MIITHVEWKSISRATILHKDITMHAVFINHLDLGVTYFWDYTQKCNSLVMEQLFDAGHSYKLTIVMIKRGGKTVVIYSMGANSK